MNQVVELHEDECLDLLRGAVVGRVAMCTARGPRIVPVNYVLAGDAIVFRTTPYSELGTYGWNADLAFEVDHLDHERRQGWSVVALGRAELIEEPAEVESIRSSMDPAPWAGGRRQMYVRLHWRDLTGRQIGSGSPEGHRSTTASAPGHRR